MIVVSLQSLGCMSPPGLKQFDPVSTFTSLTQIQKEEFVLLPRGHSFEGQKKLQLLTVDAPESSTASREMNVRGKKEILFSTDQFILDVAKYSTVLEDSFLVTIISIPMHKKA